MDSETLLAHHAHWVIEPQPETKSLSQLKPAENMLYEGLCKNQWGDRIRLEQEKVGYIFLVDALKNIN